MTDPSIMADLHQAMTAPESTLTIMEAPSTIMGRLQTTTADRVAHTMTMDPAAHTIMTVDRVAHTMTVDRVAHTTTTDRVAHPMTMDPAAQTIMTMDQATHTIMTTHLTVHTMRRDCVQIQFKPV